jgi:glycosyltransferase involved in cell wall biosynthesis
MPRPDLTIIVTSFQMPGHLRRVLESIAVQATMRRLEVVVADDGSTDDTPLVVSQFAKAAPFPVHFVTHAHTAFHAARCRNEGVSRASAPHLLFVDGDCLLPPDHVEQHLRAARPGSVTCSYCIRLEEAVSAQVTLDCVRSGEYCRWVTADDRRKLRHMHFKSIWYTVIGHPTKPSFRSGNFALARDDFERINGFDENFRGWGCEDDDFGRRLRIAGVQAVSVLNRTCVYHLWHPPAPTRPAQWKQGGNVAYLHRPIRLARCISGLVKRQPDDLSVRVMVEGDWPGALQALVAEHGWRIEPSRRVRTDLELLAFPGRGRFSLRTDCRLLAVLDENLFGGGSSVPHIVLSPSGRAGGPAQVRLRLDDAAGLWNVLRGGHPVDRRAAA